MIPGLWDMHVHFVFDQNLTHEMADLFLDYGITSARDTGGDTNILAALRSGTTQRHYANNYRTLNLTFTFRVHRWLRWHRIRCVEAVALTATHSADRQTIGRTRPLFNAA